jgi:hypothetical protein
VTRDAVFLTALRVEELPDGRHLLWEPLAFYSAELRGVVIAPAGFVSDYASVPQGYWNLFPKDGPWKHAAVLHDAGYQGALITQYGEPLHLIKPLADKLFREAMTVPPCDRVPRWKRWVMYRGVVRFGGRVYGGLGTAT